MPRKKQSAPKLGYGYGSVHEEKAGSGRWVAELDGVRRRARSKEEAEEKLRMLQDRRDAKLKIKKGSITVGEWFTIWLDRYCDHLKAKTLEGYHDVVRLYIEPYAIARIRLEDLSSDDVHIWLATIRRKRFTRGKNATPQKISSSTVAIAFRRLRRALEVARTNDIIAKNPAEGIAISTGETEREHVILEPEQIMAFLNAWAGRRLYALYAVFVTVGLRRNEVLGLRWRDINLDERTIAVCGQLQWLKSEPDQPRKPVWVPSTKTRAGKRLVDISQELVDILRAWRRTQREERLLLGPAWHGDDYAFTSEAGGPINPRNLYRGFKYALKRAKLPQEMTIHDLRHCAGSLMLAGGEDIEAVSELLGHSSRAVTERIYAHALRTRKRRAGESLGYLLRKVQ